MSNTVRKLTQDRWLLALLLAAVAMRAIVPAGFMPGAGGIILCPGYAAGAQSAGSSAVDSDMSGMDMSAMDSPETGMPDSGDSPHRTPHGPMHAGMAVCPFAAAASLQAAPPFLHPLILQLATIGVVRLPDRLPLRHFFELISLPRGPPRAFSLL